MPTLGQRACFAASERHARSIRRALDGGEERELGGALSHCGAALPGLRFMPLPARYEELFLHYCPEGRGGAGVGAGGKSSPSMMAGAGAGAGAASSSSTSGTAPAAAATAATAKNNNTAAARFRFKCQDCGCVPEHPAVCLICGTLVCAMGKRRARGGVTACRSYSRHDRREWTTEVVEVGGHADGESP